MQERPATAGSLFPHFYKLLNPPPYSVKYINPYVVELAAMISVFERSVNIRKRLASAIQENPANGLADRFVGPIRVLRAQRSRF